jgi:hypothetical protein
VDARGLTTPFALARLLVSDVGIFAGVAQPPG